MIEFNRKIVLSFVICAMGIGISHAWYHWDLQRSHVDDTTGKIQLATVEEVSDLVQRRQAKKVLWRRIDEKAPLFAGEAVRTSSESEALIVFGSGAQINLEPDTVVVIEEAKEKVTIDFVKGNVFVQGGDQTQQLALKSGNTQIDLKNADMSLGKKGKDLNVDVIRGRAEVAQNGKKVLLDQNKSGRISGKGLDVQEQLFRIKSPDANAKLYIPKGKKVRTKFVFEPLSSGYNVRLLVGRKRSDLKPAGKLVSGRGGRVGAALKGGTLYWRLEAVDAKNPSKVVQSPIRKLKLVVESAPELLFPIKNQIISLKEEEEKKLSLKWLNPNKLETLQLQISRDPRFAKTIFSGVVPDKDFHDQIFPADGEYYWRITGTRAGSKVRLTAATEKFRIKSGADLIPPKHLEPRDRSHVGVEALKNEAILLSWRPVDGIPKYEVTLEQIVRKGLKLTPFKVTQQVEQVGQFRLPELQPGTYKWNVVSINNKGKKSKASKSWTFRVKDVPIIFWKDRKDKGISEYVSKKPTMLLSWRPVRGEQVLDYRLFVKEKGSDKDEVVFNGKTLRRKISVPKDAVYEVRVVAYGKKDRVIARTKVRDETVALRALLPAPLYSGRTPASISASRSGSTTVSWVAVPKAASYNVIVKSQDGKVVKKQTFKGLTGSFKGLYPGNYKVSLSTNDRYEREGPEGVERDLVVPATSDVRAPGLKKFKIQ